MKQSYLPVVSDTSIQDKDLYVIKNSVHTL